MALFSGRYERRFTCLQPLILRLSFHVYDVDLLPWPSKKCVTLKDKLHKLMPILNIIY